MKNEYRLDSPADLKRLKEVFRGRQGQFSIEETRTGTLATFEKSGAGEPEPEAQATTTQVQVAVVPDAHFDVRRSFGDVNERIVSSTDAVAIEEVMVTLSEYTEVDPWRSPKKGQFSQLHGTYQIRFRWREP